jgi:hypothetical protein
MTLAQQTSLGQLRMLETFVYWNGPRLFTCINERSELFLVSWIEEHDEVERWWYVPISTSRLEEVRSGSVQIADAISAPEGALIEVLTGPDACAALHRDPTSVSPDDLPVPGDRLSASTPLSEVLADDARLVASRSTNAEILDAALVGEPVDDHQIAPDLLRRFLGGFVEWVKVSAEAARELFDVRIHAFAPGSFVVRLSSGASRIGFVSDAIAALDGDAPQSALQAALPNPATRAAFATLAQSLTREGLGLRLAFTGRNGAVSKSELTAKQLESLRERLTKHEASVRDQTITGTLQAASIAKREVVVLNEDGKAITVAIPPDQLEWLRGRRIGKKYEIQVREVVLKNAFGDEVDSSCSLAPHVTPDTDTDDDGQVEWTPGRPSPVSSGLPQPLVLDGATTRWTKRMTVTDARRGRGGVPYLRLTQAGNPVAKEQATFREALFGPYLEWSTLLWGRSRVQTEVAHMTVAVVWPGYNTEAMNVMITYDPQRAPAPAVWLHWPKELRRRLEQESDFTGKWVVIERHRSGSLAISFSDDEPEWHRKSNRRRTSGGTT